MERIGLGVVGLGLVVWGCAGGAEPATPAKASAPPPAATPAPAPPPPATAASTEVMEDEPPPAPKKKELPPVEFGPNLSVEQAIAAVPQGYDRQNIEPTRLSEPLIDFSNYEGCKLGSSQHFRIRVAVWDGRAVGIDIETQPRNDALAQCLRSRVEQARWRDKVQSLETTEVSF